MDWRRVKSILIALLLVTNLLLGFNIYSHYMEQRLRETQGIQRAIGLMSNGGWGITVAMVEELPVTMNRYQFQRDVEAEEAFSLHLLGPETICQVHGGGVYDYTSPLGTVRFSRGGIRLDILLMEEEASLEGHVNSLRGAGLGIKAPLVWEEEGLEGVLTQQLEGHPVTNGTLELRLVGSTFTVSGQWVLSSLMTVTPITATRAELLLALNRAMAAMGLPETAQVLSITPGYLMDQADGRDIFLKPIWTVETAQGVFALDLGEKTGLVLS